MVAAQNDARGLCRKRVPIGNDAVSASCRRNGGSKLPVTSLGCAEWYQTSDLVRILQTAKGALNRSPDGSFTPAPRLGYERADVRGDRHRIRSRCGTAGSGEASYGGDTSDNGTACYTGDASDGDAASSIYRGFAASSGSGTSTCSPLSCGV